MSSNNGPVGFPLVTGLSVLSLQKTACLSILANLKSFSTNSLSQLPVKLRQELLLNIPVHDMWILEESSFVDGIDMKAIWTAITKERMPATFSDKLNISPISKCSHCIKQKYMETLGFIILNKVWSKGINLNHYQLALDLIFSVHYCMGIMNWRKFLGGNTHWRQHFQSFPPPRQHIIVPTKYYDKYYCSGQGVSDVQLISLLLDGCCYHPTQMNIFAPSFVSTPIWVEVRYPSVLERFRRFVSRANSLWFCSSGSVEPLSDLSVVKTYPEMLSLIVTEMITSASAERNFKHLHLQAPNVTSLSHLINSIAYFFAVLTNYENIRTNNCTPYKHLKELTLIHEEQPCHLNIDIVSLDCLFRNLSDIISFQPNLNELNLGGINFACVTQNLRGLITAFVHHMNRECGSVLSFSTCHMMLYFFQVMIETFLISRVCNDQVLRMSQVVIDQTTIPIQSEFYTSVISMPEEGFNFKHYKFSDMHLPHPTGYWLLHRAHQIRLHTLELHDIRVDPGCSLLTQIAKHPNLRVRRIYLSKIEIPHCYITVQDFQLLLVKKDLEVLSICECNLGENGVLQDLTIAFSLLFSYRHMLVSVLNLRDNKIGAETDKNLHNFFAALFGMYSIRALGLDIRNNQLTPKHFGIMLAEWKRCAGRKKLRQLHCQGNDVVGKQKYMVGELSQWTFV